MTGEITLRGKVLPVGGIKEKVLAAHRIGIRTVILPRRNERDVEDVPEELRRELSFVFADDAAEVLRQCPLRPPPPGPSGGLSDVGHRAIRGRVQAGRARRYAPALVEQSHEEVDVLIADEAPVEAASVVWYRARAARRLTTVGG